MSCGRTRRELLWLVRFGEFDEGSAPHLDHLAGCRACREEIGIDRALVRQLRTALAARIEDATPSPAAWDGVLARMRQPEPRPSAFRAWATRLAAGLRAGTAMAGAGLALVLALNLDVVPPTSAPSPDPAREAASRPDWAGEVPPFVTVAPPAAVARNEPEAAEEVTGAAIRQSAESEQLPLGRASVVAAPADDEAEAPAPPAAPREPTGWQVRLVPSDAARIAATDAHADGGPAEVVEPIPLPLVAGPS